MAKENYWQIRFDEADGRVVQRLAQVYGVDPKARGAIPAIIRQALRNEYARWHEEEKMDKMTLQRAASALNNPFAPTRKEHAIEAAQYVLRCKSASAGLRQEAEDFLNQIWIEEAETVREANRRTLHIEESA